MRLCLAALCLLVTSNIGVIAQRHRPTPAVLFYDLAAVPKLPYGPYPDARAVLTESSSFVIATVPSNWRQTPHHHEQEQVTMGVAGSLGYLIGSEWHQLGSHEAGLPPPNVEHGMRNETDSPAVVIEYQPVLRREWLPPHPKVPPALQTPQPLSVPASAQLTVDFGLDSPGWRTDETTARLKVLSGETIRATFVDLSAAGGFIDVGAPPIERERLVYILDGRVAATVNGDTQVVSPEMLISVESGQHVRMASTNHAGSLLVVFEPLR